MTLLSLRVQRSGTKQSRPGYLYLMMNKVHTVIYTGVTSNLQKRIYEHKEGITGGFTTQYHVHKLVYYEVFDDIQNAILREKQLKGGSRERKMSLIRKSNPDFKDLYDQL